MNSAVARLLCIALAALLSVGALAPAAHADTEEIDRGARLFAKECGRCHEIGSGARRRVGPHLNEIFGRRAGSVDGFRYSNGMERAGANGLFWWIDTIDALMKSPRALVSNTRMSYRGLEKEADRAAIIAYLRAYSANPRDIPESAPTEAPSTVAPVSAELTTLLAVDGDVAYGEYLAAECVTCHQLKGQEGGVPSVTGWPDADFKAAMFAYRAKTRPNKVMQLIAANLGDDEIAALAAYFAQQ